MKTLEQKTTRFVLSGHVDTIVAFKTNVDQYVADEIAKGPLDLEAYTDDRDFREKAPELAWMVYNSVHRLAVARIAEGIYASGKPRPVIARSHSTEILRQLAGISQDQVFPGFAGIIRFADIQCERWLGEPAPPVLIDYSSLDELARYEPVAANGLRFNEAHRMLLARIADGWHHMGVERPTIVPFIDKSYQAFLQETGSPDGAEAVNAWALSYKDSIREITKEPQAEKRPA